MLKTQELQGLQSSMAAVVNRSNGLLDDMMLVLTPGKLRMNDEERIGLINRVDEEGSELLQQFRSIVNGYSSLVDRRMLRQREVKSIRSLYGIKQ
jgi:enoyl-CoA hydratase/carnithine racemase